MKEALPGSATLNQMIVSCFLPAELGLYIVGVVRCKMTGEAVDFDSQSSES